MPPPTLSGPAALAAYGAERRPRTTKVAQASDDHRAKTAGPLARRVRDVVMPIVVSRLYERATSWLYECALGRLPVARP